MYKSLLLEKSVVINSRGDQKTLMSWDKVNIELTSEAKAAGFDVLFDLPVKSAKVIIEAGSVGYVDIEFYGDVYQIKKSLKEDLKDIWLMPKGENPDDLNTFVVRCLLWELSLSATTPVPCGSTI